MTRAIHVFLSSSLRIFKFVKMFWGVTVQTDRSHREIVKDPFHVSMASLEWHSKNNETTKERKFVSVMLRYQGREFVLCTLEYGKVMCVPLDLVFDREEQIEFYLMGNGIVHLSGFITNEYDENSTINSNDDSYLSGYSTSEESETSDKIDKSSSDSSSSDSSEESPEPKIKDSMIKSKANIRRSNSKEKVNIKGKVPAKNNIKEARKSNDTLDPNKNRQIKQNSSRKKIKNESEKIKSLTELSLSDINENIERIEENSKSFTKTPEKSILTSSKSDNEDPSENRLTISSSNIKSPKPGQKEKKSEKRNPVEEKETSIPKTKKKKKSIAESSNNISNKISKENKEINFKSQNNVKIKDAKVGNGPAARKGKLVHLCYVGSLNTGEEFSSARNRPFSFRLGNDPDVVKGLNSGIEGMRVGGKRLIIIPPSEGYGNKAVGSIPPNSTLTYEVELKAVS